MIIKILQFFLFSNIFTVDHTAEKIDPNDYEACGLNSLYLVCQMLEKNHEFEHVKQVLGPRSEDGMHTFENLVLAGKQLGLNPIAIQSDISRIVELPMPMIVQVVDREQLDSVPHFLVLLKVEATGVVLLDSPMPAYFLPLKDFLYAWSGYAIVFPADLHESDRIIKSAEYPLFPSWIKWVIAGLLGLCGFTCLALHCTRNKDHIVSANAFYSPSRILLFFCKPQILFLLLSSVGIGVVVWFNQTTSLSEAYLGIPRQHIELGELSPGIYNTSVKIQNNGDLPLQIFGIRSSCTCANVKFPKLIDPHSSVEFEVELNINRGPQSARLVIDSNSQSPDNTIRLMWHGKSKPTLEPFGLFDEHASIGKHYVRVVKLAYPSGPRAIVPQLDSWECKSPLVNITEGKNNPKANLFRLNASGQPFGELELLVAVSPPSSGVLEEVCKINIRQGDEVYALQLPLSLRFRNIQLAPSGEKVVFSATHGDQLIGQVQSLRLGKLIDGDWDIQGIPKWLVCNLDRSDLDNPQLFFKVIENPGAGLSKHNLILYHKKESSLQLLIQLHTYIAAD